MAKVDKGNQENLKALERLLRYFGVQYHVADKNVPEASVTVNLEACEPEQQADTANPKF